MKKLTVSTTIILAGILVTLIPAEFWFLVWWLVGPVGFWEKALIAGAGLWICGGMQVVFLMLGIRATMIALSEYLD